MFACRPPACRSSCRGQVSPRTCSWPWRIAFAVHALQGQASRGVRLSWMNCSCTALCRVGDAEGIVGDVPSRIECPYLGGHGISSGYAIHRGIPCVAGLRGLSMSRLASHQSREDFRQSERTARLGVLAEGSLGVFHRTRPVRSHSHFTSMRFRGLSLNQVSYRLESSTEVLLGAYMDLHICWYKPRKFTPDFYSYRELKLLSSKPRTGLELPVLPTVMTANSEECSRRWQTLFPHSAEPWA